MYTLGINSVFHDSAACLVADGRVIAAAEEERFTRVKHDGAVPLRAIQHCLDAAGIEMAEVDLVAFPERAHRTGRGSKLAGTSHRAMADLARAGTAVLLISSEVEEVLGLSHRVVVMRQGRVSANFTASETSPEEVLAAAFADKEAVR